MNYYLSSQISFIKQLRLPSRRIIERRTDEKRRMFGSLRSSQSSSVYKNSFASSDFLDILGGGGGTL